MKKIRRIVQVQCPDCAGMGRQAGQNGPCPTCKGHGEIDIVVNEITWAEDEVESK